MALNNNEEKIELFERMPIRRAVLTMSVPTILSSLVMVLYNLADTYFVGMLNDAVQNSAVTLAAPLLLAFNAVNNLFGIGSSSMMSRSLGKKDYDAVRKSAAFGFYCALISGLLFSAAYLAFRDPLLTILGTDSETVAATAGYCRWTVACGAAPAILNVVIAQMVRAEGSSVHASIGTMSGCLLNIVLDPIFILPWGLGMGAAGAGLATFLSNCFACGYFFVLLWVKRGRTFVAIHPKWFRPEKDVVLSICAVGVPASIQNLLNVTGMTVLNNFTSVYGPDAVAAMGISYKLSMIPMYIGMGFSQGVMPLVGYNYAARDRRRMRESILFAAGVSLAFMAVITAGYFVFASGLIRLFMKNGAVVAYGARFLRGMCLAQPLLCVDFLAVGVFQACGMGRKALIFALLRKVALEIPALVILNRLFPLYGLAYAQPLAELVLAIAAVFSIRQLIREPEPAAPPPAE